MELDSSEKESVFGFVKMDSLKASEQKAAIAKLQDRTQSNNQEFRQNWEEQWPPEGWSLLGDIRNPKGYTARIDRETGVTEGLSYEISSGITDGKYRFVINVQEFSYDASGRNAMKNVLRLSLLKCANADRGLKTSCVRSAEIFGQPTGFADDNAVTRFVIALAYIIAKIDKGNFPDVKRILKLHNLMCNKDIVR